MQIEPLPKKIHDKLKKAGVKKLQLCFEGGNDEGILNIEADPYEAMDDKLEQEIDEWVWNVYSYSGAGEGSPYGDNILYDLEENTQSWSEWYMSISEGTSTADKLEIKEDEDEE